MTNGRATRRAAAIGARLVIAWAMAGCAQTAPTAPRTSTADASIAVIEASPTVAAPSSSPSQSPPMAPESASPPHIADDAELLFEWWDQGVFQLWLARASGDERRVIASDLQPGERHGDASWSHDGARFLFQAGALYHSSIWTADASGADGQRLLRPDAECRLGMSSPAWSPDDTSVLFVCNDGASDTDPQFTSTIEVLDVAAGRRRRVVGVAAPSQIVYAGWSRDGRTIVYQQGEYAADLTTEMGSAIRSIPVAGGRSREIVDASASAAYPYWSPTDERILFSSNGYEFQTSDRGSNLFTVRPDGSDLRQLTRDSVDGSRRYMATGWTLDGTAVLTDIALAGDGRTLNDVHLGIMPADGGRPTPIAGDQSGSWARIRPGT